MKLLLIDPSIPQPGEAAKIDAFRQIEGVELPVLTGDVQEDGTRTTRIDAILDRYKDTVRIGRTLGKFPNRTFMTSGLIRCLSEKPDIILAYSDTDHLLTLQIAAARLFVSPRSKIIVQTWENQPKSFTSHPQPSTALYLFDSLVEKVILGMTDAVVARNPEAAQVLTDRGFKKPLRIIPWGVDTDLFKFQQRASRDRFSVGYVGRLDASKGVDDLLKALADLSQCRALIVGDGPERSNLQNLANQLSLDCHFTGGVPQDEIPNLLAIIDLFVLPSHTTQRWAEQFGRAAVEAMSTGIPFIGSSSGAIPWVLNDPDLIYPEGDVAALNKLIQRMQTDAAFYQQKAASSLQRARGDLNWQKHAQRTVEFCREILEC